MAVPKRRMSLEEFLGLPEEKPALEFEDGLVTQKVPPQGKHGRLQWWISTLFNTFAEPRKLATAVPELRTTYSGASRVPDIAVYVWERIPRDERGRIADDFRLPPDIAVEILSPGQRVSSLVDRCRSFVERGVQIAILVDPYREDVRLFRPGRAPQQLSGADEIDLGDVIPGFILRVSEIFDSLML